MCKNVQADVAPRKNVWGPIKATIARIFWITDGRNLLFFENFVLFLNFHETKRIGNDGIQTKDNQRLDQLDQSHYP